MLSALPEDLSRFQQLCCEVSDWERLLEAARAEGVAGVLWYYLALPETDVSAELKKDAARSQGFQRLAETRLRLALDEILLALAAAGIRSVPLKGTVLGDRIYPAPSLRPCSDIDLLVAECDVARASEVLRGLGYNGEEGALEQWYRENHHHIHFIRPQTPAVELHFRATTGFGTIVPAEDFLLRAVPYHLLDGGAAWVLSPEDELIYLGVHAARHLFEALFWLYDLKLFLRSYSHLDWSLMSTRASSLGVVGALALALDMVEHRLAVPIPQRRFFAPPHPVLARMNGPALALTARQPKGTTRELFARLLFRAVLCDHLCASMWRFRHRALRFARRQAHHYFAGAVPAGWAR